MAQQKDTTQKNWGSSTQKDQSPKPEIKNPQSQSGKQTERVDRQDQRRSDSSDSQDMGRNKNLNR